MKYKVQSRSFKMLTYVVLKVDLLAAIQFITSNLSNMLNLHPITSKSTS